MSHYSMLPGRDNKDPSFLSLTFSTVPLWNLMTQCGSWRGCWGYNIPRGVTRIAQHLVVKVNTTSAMAAPSTLST